MCGASFSHPSTLATKGSMRYARPFLHAIVALATVLSIVTPAPAVAQRADDLAVGARVRVRTTVGDPRDVVGTLLRVDSAGVVIREVYGDSVRIMRPGIRTLEVSRGWRTAGDAAWRGAGWGFLVGAGLTVTALAVSAVHVMATDSCGDYCGLGFAVMGIMGTGLTIATSAIGAIVGLGFRERWERVRLE